jgi:Rtr1/RPAP2 family
LFVKSDRQEKRRQEKTREEKRSMVMAALEPQPQPPTPPTSAVYRLQMILLEHGAPSERHLLAAAALLSRSDYSDVVVERSIASLCGFPLCPNPLELSQSSKSKSSKSAQSARFHISLSEHRVYDLEERAKFCSDRCLIHSRAYQAALPDERERPLSACSAARAQHLLNSFFTPTAEKLNLNTSSPPLQLKQSQSEDLKGDLAEFEAWIGPLDAIEGYVPKSTSKSASHLVSDFKSEIIFPDDTPTPDFSSFQTQDVSDHISKQLESIALHQRLASSQGPKPSSPSPKPKAAKNLASSKIHLQSAAAYAILTTILLNFFSYDHCRCRWTEKCSWSRAFTAKWIQVKIFAQEERFRFKS